MLLADLFETKTLPPLVDGRDIFLKDGEKIIRVLVNYSDNEEPYPVYVSSLTQPIHRGDTTFLRTFVMGRGGPGSRETSVVPIYYLQPYPEDAGVFRATFGDLLKEMSMQDLKDAERVIEYLFKDMKLDVVWTTHFIDRVIDGGREEDVTKFELAAAFQKMRDKYGDRLAQARNNHKEFVGILKDLAADLNIPFAIDFDRRNPLNNKYRLRGITIMRKDPKTFKTNVSGGTELRV